MENNRMTTESATTPIPNCPPWASEMISKILVMEVEAGTIKNPTHEEKPNNWSTLSLDEMSKTANRLDKQFLQDTAQEVEHLFGKIANGLTAEGFSPESIASVINARIPTGCRLPYCNAQEVTDVITN